MKLLLSPTNKNEYKVVQISEPEDASIVKYIKWRISNNKNFITAITGPTGSGKSWSALSMAEQLDDEFNINRVVFRAGDLMNLINNDKSLKPGSVIIWDEAGVDLSNRNWQSTMNKVINYLLQTFRHKNFVLIFTVPYSDFIDSSSRKLFHGEFITCGVNKRLKTCALKPKMLQYNSSMKKWYAKYIKVQSKGKGRIKIKRWKLKKPSDKLIKDYEELKNKFTKELNQDIEVELKGKGIKKDEYKIKNRHRDLYLIWHLKTKNVKEIAKDLSVGARAVYRMKETMDKLYPEWINDKNMLGDLSELNRLALLSPTQLKYLDVEDFSSKKTDKKG